MKDPGEKLLGQQIKAPWFRRCPVCRAFFVFRPQPEQVDQNGTVLRHYACSKCGHSQEFVVAFPPDVLPLHSQAMTNEKHEHPR